MVLQTQGEYLVTGSRRDFSKMGTSLLGTKGYIQTGYRGFASDTNADIAGRLTSQPISKTMLKQRVSGEIFCPFITIISNTFCSISTPVFNSQRHHPLLSPLRAPDERFHRKSALRLDAPLLGFPGGARGRARRVLGLHLGLWLRDRWWRGCRRRHGRYRKERLRIDPRFVQKSMIFEDLIQASFCFP
jgi:hypothetical protein